MGAFQFKTENETGPSSFNYAAAPASNGGLSVEMAASCESEGVLGCDSYLRTSCPGDTESKALSNARREATKECRSLNLDCNRFNEQYNDCEELVLGGYNCWVDGRCVESS